MKILLAKTHALGDVLLTTPAVRHLAQVCPEHQYDYLTGSRAAMLIAENPHIFERIYIKESSLFGASKHLLLPLLLKLRAARYDAACVFAPAAGLLRLLRWAGIKHIFAPRTQSSPKYLSGWLPWQPMDPRYIAKYYLDLARLTVGLEPLEGEENVDLLPQLPLIDEAEDSIDKLLHRLGITDVPYLIVAPGGGKNVRDNMTIKRWHAYGFAEVGAKLCRDYGLLPVLVGDKGDLAVTKEVHGYWDGLGLNLCDATNMSTLPVLIDRAKMVLCNDSLVMHLALARARPFVAVFGPTDPRILLPPSHQRNVVSPVGFDCAPCFSNSPFPGCRLPPSKRCIASISADAVYARAKVLAHGY